MPINKAEIIWDTPDPKKVVWDKPDPDKVIWNKPDKSAIVWDEPNKDEVVWDKPDKSKIIWDDEVPQPIEKGPEQRPPKLNQMKVFGIVEGMPAELRYEIEKAALEYDREGGPIGSIRMPETSIVKTLGQAFTQKNVKKNIDQIVNELSSTVSLGVQGIYGLGKNAIKDLNEAVTNWASGEEEILPESRTVKQLAKIKEAPGVVYDAIIKEVDTAKGMGVDQYLHKFVRERPVDALFVAGALKSAVGKGTRLSLQATRKVARNGSAFADGLDDILSTKRTPLYYKMPAEITEGGPEASKVSVKTIIDKTIEFPREYSKDPLAKYLYQKPFDSILKKHPNLEQSLTEKAGGYYLTELRKTYDSANVRERIAFHKLIDEQLGTLTKEELKVAVPYLEGRASLFGGTSDAFDKFEDWYRSTMKTAEKDLIDRGILTPERIDELIYDPLVKTTGKTLAEVKNEFGDFAPAYVHQAHTKYPKKMQTEFADTTGKRAKVGILKRRNVGTGYSEDLREALPKWASEYTRFKNTEAFIKDLTDNFGIEANIKNVKQVEGGLKVGDKVYKGYRIVAPDGYLRFYQGKIDMYKEVSKKLDNLDFDEAIGTTIKETVGDAFVGDEKKFVGVSKNQKVYLIPENIAKNLEDWAAPRFGSQKIHNRLKLVYDKPVGFWKDTVLAAAPRWLKNNVMGDIMFNSMEGVGPLSYGRAFSAKYTKLIPDELLKASFADTMKYNPKLGKAAESQFGKMAKRLGETKIVKGASKLKDAAYAVNTAAEQPFVRSLYISNARDLAKKLLKEERQIVNESSIMYKMEEIKNSPTLRAPLIKKVKETLPVFDLSGTFERKYAKMVMPFYNWYKFMFKYGTSLPAKHPFKLVGARGLGGLSEIEREQAFSLMFPFMKDEIERNGIPNRYDHLWPIEGQDEKGDAKFFNARGLNPFTTIIDYVEGDFVNLLSPIVKIGLEQATGLDMFTGREYQDAEQGRGEFQEFEKTTPPLVDHILSQFPQYKLLKESLVEGKQWASGTLMNPDPILDKITGEYKYPIKSVEKVLNYIGIDNKTLDIEDTWQQFQKNRNNAIGQTFTKDQSKFEKFLSAEEVVKLLNFIREDPERWNEMKRKIEYNEKYKAAEQRRTAEKLRGE